MWRGLKSGVGVCVCVYGQDSMGSAVLFSRTYFKSRSQAHAGSKVQTKGLSIVIICI
jgi:hypothetical protein